MRSALKVRERPQHTCSFAVANTTYLLVIQRSGLQQGGSGVRAGCGLLQGGSGGTGGVGRGVGRAARGVDNRRWQAVALVTDCFARCVS